MITSVWMILWLPFLIAAAITLKLRAYPKLSAWLATAGMFLCFGLTLALCAGAPLHSSIVWISLGSVPIEFGVFVNGLTLLMLLMVTGIGSLIFLYSISYMEKENGLSRYFASLSFFVFSMLGIVVSNNLIQTFIFWELVGLSSYLLISFWYEKPEAATAGKKAFLTTRVGDIGMMIGILLLFLHTGTFDFGKLANHSSLEEIPSAVMTAIALLLFMGVMGKSAQMPLHVWLPDAMEGPTPVSALIHAATMVAAGVFLLARLFFIFDESPSAMTVIAWTGALTALAAGLLGIVQNDIKKILAYSTLSQLGLMVMAIGCGSAEAGMFHLTTHAFFKALLFLAAGSLIHGMHTQDIWKMKSTRQMPITALALLIGAAALTGIPFTSGFASKEEILIAASQSSVLLLIVGLAVVFISAFYMGRVCTILLFGSVPTHAPHESGWKMTLPLLILSLFSLISGYLPIKNWFLSELVHSHGRETHPHLMTFISVLLVLVGLGLAFFIYRGKSATHVNPRGSRAREPLGLTWVLEKKYFFDDFYDFLIRSVQEKIAQAMDWSERKVVVQTGVNGTAKLVAGAGNLLRQLQTGVLQSYALIFTLGLLALICLILFPKT